MKKLEVKESVTDTKTSNRLISRLSTAKEGICEFDDRWVEIDQTEKQKTKYE